MSLLRENFIAFNETPPAHIVQQKMTVQIIQRRLSEIAQCAQFKIPPTPGMTEFQCYEAIFDLDHEADGTQISEKYRDSLPPMNWEAVGLE